VPVITCGVKKPKADAFNVSKLYVYKIKKPRLNKRGFLISN